VCVSLKVLGSNSPGATYYVGPIHTELQMGLPLVEGGLLSLELDGFLAGY
jgi:hypothetical protein